MSIRNVLVAYNGTETSERAVRLAVQLAKAQNAHLTGVYAHAMPATYVQMDAYLPQDAMATMAAHEKEAEDRVGKGFADLMSQEGLDNRTTFVAYKGYPNDVLSEFARTFDITVVGVPEGDTWDAYHEPHPDTIAYQSGRPVLVAPTELNGNAFEGGTVLAWDGKRAAARALGDAMEVLEQDQKVLVVHVGEEHDVRKPGRDIMMHLSRHDIHAELTCYPRNGRAISEIVLETCEMTGAGLLVMGAYEHSRFSETLFGGMTKDILKAARMPVLMSH